MRIPGGLRIDHNHGAVAALIEATRLVDANVLFKPALLDFFLQRLKDCKGALIRASLPGYTDKNVFLVNRQLHHPS